MIDFFIHVVIIDIIANLPLTKESINMILFHKYKWILVPYSILSIKKYKKNNTNFTPQDGIIEDDSSNYAISHMWTYIAFLNTKAWGPSTSRNLV